MEVPTPPVSEEVPVPVLNRDISWLSFNYRVLQEAKDPSVPVIERLRFLAIYSSNLDEFYRVRVASYRSLIRLKKKTRKKLEYSPKKIIKRINATVDEQQQEFGEIFRHQILPELKANNIFLLNHTGLNEQQQAFVRNYFTNEVLPLLQIHWLAQAVPFLENKQMYLAIQVREGNALAHAMLNVPVGALSRFLVIPNDEHHIVIQLSDVIKASLDLLFEQEVVGAYAVKLTRDAELYLEDELEGSLVEKIKKSLKKRITGIPSRFLYDSAMPSGVLDHIATVLELQEEDLIPGGAYHNFNEFFSFPVPDNSSLVYEKMPPLPHPKLEGQAMFDAIAKDEVLLHFPYQSYNYVIRFLEEAAIDPAVQSIKITLYRVASDSKVARALIKAAQNGKEVLAFDEVKARFDEQSNIHWGEEMKKAGVNVVYSYEKLKVHTKLCIIARKEGDDVKHYTYLGTGNFNEKTANIYCDHALLTTDHALGHEVNNVFKMLEDVEHPPAFEHLLVAPHEMRMKFEAFIDREIAHASQGLLAKMTLKMNSLEDRKMIEKLYEASNAGVAIRIIVRGICCLVPGIAGFSENITVTSVVDRFLEHARVYVFHNNGADEVYVASADWMKRNLSRRVEVGFPIYNKALKAEILHLMALQVNDNTKARIIDEEAGNAYVKNEEAPVRAQLDSYTFLKT